MSGRTRGDLHALQVGEVPLGVHHRLPGHAVRHIVQLEAEHRAAPLAHGRQILVGRRGQPAAARRRLQPARRVVQLLLHRRLGQQRVRHRHKALHLLLVLDGVVADLRDGLPLLLRQQRRTPPSGSAPSSQTTPHAQYRDTPCRYGYRIWSEMDSAEFNRREFRIWVDSADENSAFKIRLKTAG